MASAKKAKKAAKKSPAKKKSKTAVKKVVKKGAKKATKKVAKKVAKKAAKKVAKKVAKKATKKIAKKAAKKTKRKPNPGFMKPLTPTGPLAGIIGSNPLPRTEVTKKLWVYIKKNNLQDAKNRRMINADEKMRPLFGKPQASMFELTKFVSKYLK